MEVESNYYMPNYGLGIVSEGTTMAVVPHTRAGENNPKGKAAVARDGQMKS